MSFISQSLCLLIASFYQAKIGSHFHIISFVFMLTITLLTAKEKRVIWLSALIPTEKTEGKCIEKAISMALEDVRNISNFIKAPDGKVYEIEVEYQDTGPGVVNLTKSFYSLHSVDCQRTYCLAKKFFTIGPPYKEMVTVLDQFSKYVSLVPTMSYIEPDVFIDKVTGRYASTTPLIYSAYPAVRALLDHFNWTRVGILYDIANKKYELTINVLRNHLQQNNDRNISIDIVAQEGIVCVPTNFSVTEVFENLQKRGVRIIIAMVGVPGARKIFCEAYKRRMTKPKVIWILFEKLPPNWASDDYNKDNGKREIDCTAAQLLEAARGYVSIVKQGIRRENVNTVGNRTRDMFKQILKERVGNDACHEDSAYAYDTMWILAHLLKIYVEKYPDIYDPTRRFVFGVESMQGLSSVSFEGVTGPVSFPKDKYYENIYVRTGQMLISVHPTNTTEIFIGIHNTEKGNLSLDSDHLNNLFNGGPVPSDSASYVTEYAAFGISLVTFMWTAASVGILFTIVCYVFMLAFYVSSERDHIKEESAFLDSIILLGSLIAYASVILYGLDTYFIYMNQLPDKCTGFVILLVISITLTYGSFLAKAWRIYKMYVTPDAQTAAANDQKVIKNVPDVYLYLIVGALILTDVIVLITWFKISQFEYTTIDISETSDLFANTITQLKRTECKHTHDTAFTITLYAYKGILMLFGVFLAAQVKTAKVTKKTDAKQISMAMYNICTVSLIGVASITLLSEPKHFKSKYVIVGVCIWICTTTNLLILYAPKFRQAIAIEKMKQKNKRINQPSRRNPSNINAPKRHERNYTPNTSPRFATFALKARPSEDSFVQANPATVPPRQKEPLPDFIKKISSATAQDESEA